MSLLIVSQALKSIYIIAGILMSVYGVFALFNVLYFKFIFKKPRFPLPAVSEWPSVSVILPLYNESTVVERLLVAVSRLEYEKTKLQIVILDDSNDDTPDKIEAFISDPMYKDLDVYLQRRREREDYKTGALRKSMNQVKGDFIAVFDADFVPPADFLLQTVPYMLDDDRLGFIQTRWGFLNSRQSVLTIIQSFSFDVHFVIEKQLEQKAGYFINYNGSAGLWRKTTIMDCGGWPINALSEDLEISFHAQSRGWKALYLPDVVVPSELTSSLYLLGIQQERWAFGGLQVFRKFWRKILFAKTSITRRFHALSLLSAYLVFAFLVAQPLVYLVSRILSLSFPVWPLVLPVYLMALFNALSVPVVSWRECRNPLRCFFYITSYVLGIFGLSVRVGWGAIKGLFGLNQVFIRTHKSGIKGMANSGGSDNVIPSWRDWLGYVVVELTLATCLMYGVLFIEFPAPRLVGTVFLLFAIGYFLIGVWTLFEAFSERTRNINHEKKTKREEIGRG